MSKQDHIDQDVAAPPDLPATEAEPTQQNSPASEDVATDNDNTASEGNE